MNFPDETPISTTRRPVKENTQKVAQKGNPNSVEPIMNESIGLFNNVENEYYNSFSLLEEKPPKDLFNYVNACPGAGEMEVKSFTPSDSANIYLTSDQGSNSFDCSDFVWGENCPRTPEISSVLSAAIEGDEAQLVENGGPTKKLKASPENSGEGSNQSNQNTFSEALSAFESQLKFFQMPYLEGNWEASIDTFLGGDATQDGGNPMDLWTFDDVPSMMGGVY